MATIKFRALGGATPASGDKFLAVLSSGADVLYTRTNLYTLLAGESLAFDTFEFYPIKATTTDDTETEMFVDGSSDRIDIADDTTHGFAGWVAARRTDADGESAFYGFIGASDRNAGTVAKVGTHIITPYAEDTAAWVLDVDVDDTNKAAPVPKVTGEAGKSISWNGGVLVFKVTG